MEPMAETAWTEEAAHPPKKRGIPTWLWFCGGGCLLAVLFAIVVAGLGYRFIRKARDPEAVKAGVQKILPYDRWPAELTPVMGFQLLGEQYTFEDSRGFQEQIQLHRGPEGSEGRKGMFRSEDPKFPKDLMVMKFEELKPGAVEVQGRELRLLRMRMQFAGFIAQMMPKEVREGLATMAFVDLTPEDLDGMLLLQITRTRGEGPITDEEIQTILEPFHVGPKR
jgi:hypothetical protein